MTTWAVRNVHAVLPGAVLADAVVVVEDGVITEVTAASSSPPGAVDGRGWLCLPGLIDSHSDGLEREVHPRPAATLPIAFALRSFEGRVRAAGVTTVFHGVGFEDDETDRRSVAQANATCDLLEAYQCSGRAMVDHRVLYRLDARDAPGFEALAARLTADAARDERPGIDADVPLVSFEDHTPGQGQHADRSGLERYIAGTHNISNDEARRFVDTLKEERDTLLGNRERALQWLVARAADSAIRLLAHDPATRADAEDARRWHASIAEFPTTLEAAARSRELGLRIVGGAPNVVQGRSHSGNVSARELIANGLCDGLASDYLPSTMLGAVIVLVAERICTLPQAVALVTSGPAATVGLHDRGALVPGMRGDLVLVDTRDGLATVRSVLRAEDHIAGDDRQVVFAGG
jgi:alpha-D-ribose 1-methylphosphonate 5-triphosphate diphosphatase